MSQSAAISRKVVCPADAICPACQEGTAEDFQMVRSRDGLGFGIYVACPVETICPACQECNDEEYQMVVEGKGGGLVFLV